ILAIEWLMMRLDKIVRLSGPSTETLAETSAMLFTQMSGPFRKFVAIGLVIAAWQVFATFDVINPFLLPPPSRLVSTFWDMLIDGSLLVHAASSLERVVVRFG